MKKGATYKALYEEEIKAAKETAGIVYNRLTYLCDLMRPKNHSARRDSIDISLYTGNYFPH